MYQDTLYPVLKMYLKHKSKTEQKQFADQDSGNARTKNVQEQFKNYLDDLLTINNQFLVLAVRMLIRRDVLDK